MTDEQYALVFGPDGACDPTTGKRLVNTTRPGLELVISAHKSVAELGVIGRADDMHQIMDAERDATLAYFEQLTTGIGGRRGRAVVRTPTEGLIYASTRHATSRAGDPGPHDGRTALSERYPPGRRTVGPVANAHLSRVALVPFPGGHDDGCEYRPSVRPEGGRALLCVGLPARQPHPESARLRHRASRPALEPGG